MNRRACPSAGFTLMEVMAALAILGMSLFILLNAHQSALRLYDTASTEVLVRELLERTMNQAELDVLAGTLSGQGDFTPRLPPEYNWSYEASLVGEDELVQLYEVNVAVRTPDGQEKLVSFLTYNPASQLEEEGGQDTRSGSQSGNARGNRNTGSSGRGRTPSNSRPSPRSGGSNR